MEISSGGLGGGIWQFTAAKRSAKRYLTAGSVLVPIVSTLPNTGDFLPSEGSLLLATYIVLREVLRNSPVVGQGDQTFLNRDRATIGNIHQYLSEVVYNYKFSAYVLTKHIV